jgi:hypothetical protein
MPIILATQKATIRRTVVHSQPGELTPENLSQKHPTQKRAGGVVQVIECQYSKCETLSSNPSVPKKEKNLGHTSFSLVGVPQKTFRTVAQIFPLAVLCHPLCSISAFGQRTVCQVVSLSPLLFLEMC